jgi:integrase
MKITVKYVVEDRDRHGNQRLYYRKAGQPKVRLRGPMGSPEFWHDYQAAVKNPTPKAKPKAPTGPDPTSMRWLITDYYASADFQRLDESTRKTRRNVLERFCLNQNDGDKPYALILPRHIRARRDALVATPAAANTLLKALRVVFKHALRNDLLTSNPAASVEMFVTKGEGFHSWTLAEVEQFEAHYPVGTTPRLALALALFTSQRRSDLVRLGPPQLRDGWLTFTQFKNRNLKPVTLEIPVIPALAEIIAASSIGDQTFLVSAHGKPFTNDGFGNRVRAWCDAAGLPHCSIHGLRKAAASRLAELGCSEFEIMAITGHQNSKEVMRYTKAARQKTRAQSALKKMQDDQAEDQGDS